MHDIKWIRKNPEEFDKAMVRRGLAPISDEILKRDKEKRGGIGALQELQEKSNALAKKIGELKSNKKDADKEIAESKEIKAQIARIKEHEESGGIETELVDELLCTLPNILDSDVPDGEDESDNEEIRSWGEIPQFDFHPKEHFEIGEALELLDFEQTAKISGTRFATLKGSLARMERALAAFMLDIHTKEFGYLEVSPPLLVRDEAVFGTSQLPKFEEDLFKTTDGKWLIPTAEVSLTNLVRESIIDEDKLPIRFTAFTPCFRSEAGSAGKDTRGLIRQHQFSKVEIVSVVKPEESRKEHERLTGAAEEILKRLELPYRVILLCAGDTGFGSIRTYDLEVWLPGQVKYREISSCSNFGDFQARRMNARYKPRGGKENIFLHTLNGSGLAVGRTLIAILENYQNKDGSVNIPKVLQPYMDGKTIIS